MKKFYSFLVAAVLLMGATSCQKEATADAGAADNVEFVASIAGGRTELGDGNKVMWNDSDKIRIFTQENFAGTEFDSDATAATATAKFTTTQSFTASDNGYLAVYPETANVKKELQGFSVVEVVNEATYAGGVWSVPVKLQEADHEIPESSFYEQSGLMVAYSNDNELSFNAAVAMLKIKCQGGQWGKFEASGANLAGEATLHYDPTAEEPISYTLAEGDTFIEYTMNATDGTYYLPIYPGTVNDFCIFEGNKKIAEYNKPFTFKAGIIYDLDLDNATIGGGNNSPYSLFNGGEWISMTIENGFHVAKNVPFAEWGYWISEGQSTFYEVSGNITMGTWMELIQGMNTGIIFEAEYADFYMAEDASMLCIVPAGTLFENLPALPVKMVSPWVLSTGMQEVTMYVDDNGYHYAKNVPAGSWWIYPENRETMHGLPVETPVDGTWYKTAAYPEAYPIGLDEPMNVYLSPEADFVCLMWPGMTLPELPEVSTLWGMAGTHQANQWTAGNPSEMYVVGDYAVAYNIPGGSQFKFIDKVNGGSNGWDNAFGATNENAMMAQVRNVCGGSNVTLPTEATSYDIYLNKTNNYFVIVPVGATLGSAPTKLYMQPRSEWMESGARFVAYFCNNGEDWVDMTDSDSDGVYECDVPTKEYPVVLFLRMNPSGSNAWGNENVWNQTGDLCVPLDGTNFATITSAGDDWNAVNVTWSTK